MNLQKVSVPALGIIATVLSIIGLIIEVVAVSQYIYPLIVTGIATKLQVMWFVILILLGLCIIICIVYIIKNCYTIIRS